MEANGRSLSDFLTTVLQEKFTLDELRDLCARFGIELENNPHRERRNDVARYMVRHFENRDQLALLEQVLREKRPLAFAAARAGADTPTSPPGPRSRLTPTMIVAIVLVVALVGVLAIWLVNLGAAAGPFDYTVRVRHAVIDEPVERARVTLEIGGAAPLNAFTDSTGFARLRVPEAYVNQPGRLIVEKDGYETQTLEIDIREGELPNQVLLSSLTN